MPGLEQELGTRISQPEMLHSSSMWKQALQGESCAAAGTGGRGVALLSLAELTVGACPAPSQARCSTDLQGRQKISCKHPLNTQLGFFPLQHPACLFFPQTCLYLPQAQAMSSGLIWLRGLLLGTELSPIHWGVL